MKLRWVASKKNSPHITLVRACQHEQISEADGTPAEYAKNAHRDASDAKLVTPRNPERQYDQMAQKIDVELTAPCQGLDIAAENLAGRHALCACRVASVANEQKTTGKRTTRSRQRRDAWLAAHLSGASAPPQLRASLVNLAIRMHTASR